ncbi:hypothetical protein QIS74_04662 [Colletotrichum tabaci]|uniref:Uncharacterized protein n=1 Tax=Colletotrichum tabaci TaxID=1209068 RepID=A0AAV9TJR3_9PEZI
MEQSDLTVPFCDARGSNFATNIKFTWTRDMDSSQAKADCTLLHGLKYGLNGRLALGRLDGRPNPEAQDGQRTMGIDRAVDPTKIQHIRLCADV